MSLEKPELIARTWPRGQSIDLVEADHATAAAAIESEVRRVLRGVPLEVGQRPWTGLDDVFGATDCPANVPTNYFVLPTDSAWTALWTDGSLLDGYASLCFNLTRVHGLRSVHWSAHDGPTTFGPGAQFQAVRPGPDGEPLVRHVRAASDDRGRWEFYAEGEPWDEEDVEGYRARRIRDRLNEARMMALLGRLGCRPWDASWYDTDRPLTRIRRLDLVG